MSDLRAIGYKELGVVAGIVLLALVLRLLHLEQLGQSPLYEVPVAQTKAYVEAAAQVLGGTRQSEVEVASPLYVWFLAATTYFLGAGTATPRLLQACLGAITCMLLWGIGRRIFGARVGLVGALVAALYGPLIYFDGELLPPTLIVVLELVLLWALLWADETTAAWRGGVAGLMLGATVLAGPHLAFLALAFLPWLWRSQGGMGKAGAFIGGIALVWLAAVLLGDGVWWSAAPGLEGVGQRLYLLWQGNESLAQLDPYYARQYSAVLAALMWRYAVAFPFGIAAPLALIGLGISLTRSRTRGENLLLLCLIAAALGGLLLADASAQARLPFVAVLLLFCGVGAAQWSGRIMQTWPQRGLCLGILALLLGGFNLGAGETDKIAARWQHYWLGYAFERLDMKVTATDEYEAAISARVPTVDAYMSLAALHGQSGHYERAIGTYRALLERWPQQRQGRLLLGDHYMMAGHPRQALEQYEALVAQGESAQVLGRLGDARLLSGDHTGAKQAYWQLLQDRPDSNRVRYQLARLYSAAGEIQEAMVAYRQLLQESAWKVKAGVELAQLLIEREEWDEAEELLVEIVATAPTAPAALWNLGALLFRHQRYVEALEPFERLSELTPNDYRVDAMLSKLYGRLGRETAAHRAFARYQEGKAQADIRQRLEVEKSALVGEILGESP